MGNPTHCLANRRGRVFTDRVNGNRDDEVELTAVLWSSPDGGFVALNPETGTTSQGETQDEALRNLAEATRSEEHTSELQSH